MRIAESVYNTSQPPPSKSSSSPGSLVNDDSTSSSDTLLGSEEAEGLTAGEKSVLNKVADALARLGRVKRVGLGVRDKEAFVEAWSKHRHG